MKETLIGSIYIGWVCTNPMEVGRSIGGFSVSESSLTASQVLAASSATRASGIPGSFKGFKGAARPPPGEHGRRGWNWGGAGGAGWVSADVGAQPPPPPPPSSFSRRAESARPASHANDIDREPKAKKTKSQRAPHRVGGVVGGGAATDRTKPGVHVVLPEQPAAAAVAPWGPGGVAPRSPMSGEEQEWGGGECPFVFTVILFRFIPFAPIHSSAPRTKTGACIEA